MVGFLLSIQSIWILAILPCILKLRKWNFILLDFFAWKGNVGYSKNSLFNGFIRFCPIVDKVFPILRGVDLKLYLKTIPGEQPTVVDLTVWFSIRSFENLWYKSGTYRHLYKIYQCLKTSARKHQRVQILDDQCCKTSAWKH